MKVRLISESGKVVKEYDLPDDAIPTPLIVIDGTSDILYMLQESGNAYDYHAAPYHIKGSKSEAMIGTDGLMYWGKKV